MGGRGGSGSYGGLHAVSVGALHFDRDPRSFRPMDAFRASYRAGATAGLSATAVATTKFPPIRIDVMHGGAQHLSDGRHRVAAAREHGAHAILARVVHYGPRGAVRSDVTRTVRLTE